MADEEIKVAAETEEAPAEETPVEGETPVEEEAAADEAVMADGEMTADEGMMMEDGMMYGMEGEMGMETQTVKDPLLSSPVAIGGISAAVAVVGIALGVLLGKLRIRKGIDLYED